MCHHVVRPYISFLSLSCVANSLKQGHGAAATHDVRPAQRKCGSTRSNRYYVNHHQAETRKKITHISVHWDSLAANGMIRACQSQSNQIRRSDTGLENWAVSCLQISNQPRHNSRTYQLIISLAVCPCIPFLLHAATDRTHFAEFIF